MIYRVLVFHQASVLISARRVYFACFAFLILLTFHGVSDSLFKGQCLHFPPLFQILSLFYRVEAHPPNHKTRAKTFYHISQLAESHHTLRKISDSGCLFSHLS